MKRFLLILFLVGCGSPEVEVNEYTDSLSVKSDSIANQALVILPKADKQVDRLIERIEIRIDNLRTEVANKVVKTIVIRDTIYITEKKNFWGKKKISVDSSQSIDSVENKLN